MRSARRPALAASGRVGPGVGEALVAARQQLRCRAPIDARRSAWRAREDRVGIDIAADLARDVGFAGSVEHQRDEGGLERGVGEDGRERRRSEPGPCRGGSPRRIAGDVVDEQARRERLHRLPAIERIAVVRGEEAQVVVADDWRRA